jgi:excisionase family DNA binding protein
LGVSESSVKRWCDQGVLSFHRTAGGHRRLKPGDVIGFIRSQNYPLVDPLALGLSPHQPGTPLSDEEVRARLQAALEAGSEEPVRDLLTAQYMAGRRLHEVFDRVVGPVFREMGHRWEEGRVQVYQERRACEICARALHDLRALLPSAAGDSPLAMGGAPSGDHYTLGTLMAELVVREAGWQGESMGVDLPLGTLEAALKARRPRMIWLSLSAPVERERFVNAYEQFYHLALSLGVAVVIGGRGLTEELKGALDYTAAGQSMERLNQVAGLIDPRRVERQ